MNESKVFCEECRNDVCYHIDNKQLNGVIKGEKYSYEGEIAFCENCGFEVYVAEVNDFNLKSLYDAYRKKNNIISVESILTILKKYDIKRRPLSLLLGWGEQTFSRYCEGDIPTRQYSDVLKKISDNPRDYLEILERNKDNISESAYKKSKAKVESLLIDHISDFSKLQLVTDYLLSKDDSITNLMLQKLLYYIQGFYYAFYSKYIFREDCQAWVHGPVYKEIYSKYSCYKHTPIDPVEKFDNTVFSFAEKAIIDSVIKNFCCYSGKTLEKFTHTEEPWLTVRGELPENVSSNRVISKELIGNYFAAVKEKYNMLTVADIQNYSHDIFRKTN